MLQSQNELRRIELCQTLFETTLTALAVLAMIIGVQMSEKLAPIHELHY